MWGSESVGLIIIVSALMLIAPRQQNHFVFSGPFVKYRVTATGMNGRSDKSEA